VLSVYVVRRCNKILCLSEISVLRVSNFYKRDKNNRLHKVKSGSVGRTLGFVGLLVFVRLVEVPITCSGLWRRFHHLAGSTNAVGRRENPVRVNAGLDKNVVVSRVQVHARVWLQAQNRNSRKTVLIFVCVPADCY
jgi:hypothetical protein